MLTVVGGNAALAAILIAAVAGDALAWQESDFRQRPVTPHVFSLDEQNLSTVIGEPSIYTFAKGDSPYQVARYLDLGINELVDAHPDLDLDEAPECATLDVPTWWVLPESDYQGIVINIPEMRLYYFPKGTNPRTVVTYPVGLGRIDWRTPMEPFAVTAKDVNPTWNIPDTIREEHIRERNDPRTMIRGGDPDNPLGLYRMRLNLPLYAIHGTNIPWGIGMQVTHGCIRLYPEDIERLFAMVDVGTPGRIVYQPVKIGARGGDVYVEAHSDVYLSNFDYQSAAAKLLEEKGWSQRVDWDKLKDALEAQRGVPTLITNRPSGSQEASAESEEDEPGDELPGRAATASCSEKVRTPIKVRANPPQLTWSLFRRVDSMSGSEDAQTAAEMSFPQGLKIQKVEGGYRMPSFTITVAPEPTETMVARSVSPFDDYLLQHEQGHYDIVVLAARALARELESMRAPSAEELSDRVQDCVTKHTDRAERLSKVYDRETHKSRDPAAQVRWNELISGALRDPGVTEIAGLPL